MESIEEKKGYRKNYGLHVILAIGIISIVIGWIYTPNLGTIIDGLSKVIVHHHRVDSELITVAGNAGSVWFNAGLISIFIWATYNLFGTQVKGLDLAAFGQLFGYSFYAASIANVWPLFIGFMIHAKVNKKNLSEVVWSAWFTTALAPFVSTLAFNVEILNPGSPFAIIFAIVFALLLGYGVGAFTGFIKTHHEGRSLFNMGFTTGVIGWFGNNILKALNIVQEPVSDQVYIEGRNMELWLVFMVINLVFILSGIIYNRGGLRSYFKELFWARTYGGDYPSEYGMGNTLINMGIIGTIALSYTLLMPFGQLNGPIIGGVFTVAGFAACGLTIRSIAPIWLGIIGGSMLMGGLGGLLIGEGFLQAGLAKVSSRGMCVAAMHSTGVAPMAERDGWKSTTLMGFLHTMNTVNTGWLHGWMQSYNNGFSLGLILTLFKPVWYFFSKERKEEELAINKA